MARTNNPTAQAATQTVRAPLRPMTLIGVFGSPDGSHILMRTRTGAIVRLETGQTVDGLELKQTGDGWAMIAEGRTIHRLVLG